MDISFLPSRYVVLLRKVLQPLKVLALLYLFLLSIDAMGVSFKLFGSTFAEALIRGTSHPVAGLFIGIMATSIVQSSSMTTAIAVGFVGGGILDLHLAVPILMGANVGTTITNILVSFGFVTRKEDFRRAFAGATVHDFFNLCSLAVFFPLEVRYRFIQRLSEGMMAYVGRGDGVTFFNPLKAVIHPVSTGARDLLHRTLGLSEGWAGGLLLAAALVLLVVSLLSLVRTLRLLLVKKAEQFINRYLFRNDMTAALLGLTLTVMVQSSSATTSLMVPLVAAGVISLRRCYPFTLGANIGTTGTAFLASLATIGAGPEGLIGVTAALVHLLFNLLGIVVFYPLKFIPLHMARWFADVACESKRWAIIFVIGAFFAVPAVVILLF